MRRVGQFGETGFQQRVDGGDDQMGVVTQRKRTNAGPGGQNTRDVGPEHRLKTRAMVVKPTGQSDFAGTVLIKAADELVGGGAAEQAHEDDALDLQVVLDDPVAKVVAGHEAPVSFLPAQTVGDSLAGLRGQTLQHIFR